MEHSDDMHDELAVRLTGLGDATDGEAAGATDGPFRVERVLRESPVEKTELVWFRGAGGGELGPFVRKRIAASSGLGGAYRELWQAQREGRRFPHLPRVVDCRDDDEALTVLLEWVPGATVREVVAGADTRQRPLLAARLMPTICDAVAELHEALPVPLIHRDLTPGNVVCPEGDPAAPVLIDLGIARAWHDGAKADTTRFGTRPYAPPEQFGFGQTDVRSDVYALGMLALFCLTGRNPVPSDREAGFAVPGVSEAWRVVIARACDLDPEKRYAGARELAAAFRAAGDPSAADSVGVAAGACEEGASRVGGALRTARVLRAVGTSRAARVPQAVHSPRVPRISRVLAVVRNAVVLFFSVGLSVLSVSMAFDGRYVTGDVYPVWYDAYGYAVMMPVLLLAVGYLALDKRWLRAHVPSLRSRTGRQDARLVGIIVAADFLVLTALYLIATL